MKGYVRMASTVEWMRRAIGRLEERIAILEDAAQRREDRAAGLSDPAQRAAEFDRADAYRDMQKGLGKQIGDLEECIAILGQYE